MSRKKQRKGNATKRPQLKNTIKIVINNNNNQSYLVGADNK